MRTIGTMRAIDEQRGAIRVQDVYDTDIADLWKACTEPDRLARWIAEVSGDLQVDGAFLATFISSGACPGRIDACDPPHHLLLTLLPETDDEQRIEAWLVNEGDRSRLTVEHCGLPLPELHLHGAGWQAHLEDLSRSLAGEQSIWNTRWTELTPTYQSLPVT